MRGRIAGSALLGVWFAASCGTPVTYAHAGDKAHVRVSIAVTQVAWIDFPDGFDFRLYVPEEYKKHSHKDKKGKGHDHGHNHSQYALPRLIKPVVIPFKVSGNTLASISVKPGQFLRLKSGSYLGKAVRIGSGDHHDHDHGHGHSGKDNKHNKDERHGHGHGHGHHGNPPSTGNAIGYNIIAQFPIPSWGNANPNGWEMLLASFVSGFASLTGQNNQGTKPLTANLAQRPRGTFGVLYIVSKVNWTADGKDAVEGKYGGSVELTLTPLNN